MRALVPLVCVCLLLTGCQSRALPEVSIDLDAGVPVKARAPPARQALRVSVAAMMSPSGTFEAYRRLLDQLGRELGTDVELVQRRTYRETNDLLATRSIDFAFICTGGFVDLKAAGRDVEPLVVPVVRGVTTYQSLILVPVGSPVRTFEELAGHRFAFTDELSLSGFAWPTWRVRQAGLDPVRFFTSAYFTRSHDRSVESVAKGVVDGAAVDSVIFADMVEADPGLARRVRIVERSENFGMPPVVASQALDAQTRSAVRRWLTSLHLAPEGRVLLQQMGIQRFVEPPPGLYARAQEVIQGAKP